MKLPNITQRQETILILLFRYRFLNRIQIQTLMGHKDYRRINAWLSDLRDKHYLEWIYSTDFLEKSKPGIYYLGINSIRWLKENQDNPIEEVRKRYREAERSRGFIDQCVLVADLCIFMNQRTAENLTTGNIRYQFATQADYSDPENEYYFLSDSDLIRPQLIFEKTIKESGNITATTRIVEIIDASMPRYRVRKRLKNYIEYQEDGYWQDETSEDEPNPYCMFVCPTLNDLIYCKRATKRLLEEKWGDDISLWFTTTEKLQTYGMAGAIWEVVYAPDNDYEDEDDEEDTE